MSTHARPIKGFEICQCQGEATKHGKFPVSQLDRIRSHNGSQVFQSDTVDLGMGSIFKYQTKPFNWKLKDLKDSITRTQSIISGTDAWTTVFMENHDQARSISRFGNDAPEWRVRSGKMLASMNAALSGTLYIYQGQ